MSTGRGRKTSVAPTLPAHYLYPQKARPPL